MDSRNVWKRGLHSYFFSSFSCIGKTIKFESIFGPTQLAPLENNDGVAIFQFYVGNGVGCMVTSDKSRSVKTLSTWNKILTHPDRGVFVCWVNFTFQNCNLSYSANQKHQKNGKCCPCTIITLYSSITNVREGTKSTKTELKRPKEGLFSDDVTFGAILKDWIV